VDWFKLTYKNELLIKIPNDAIRTCAQARTMFREGLVPGAPDIFIAAPRGGLSGMFIELKRSNVKGQPKGKVSDKQQAILDHLNSVGYLAIVSYGWDFARKAICQYMES